MPVTPNQLAAHLQAVLDKLTTEISTIPHFSIEVVDSLPTQDISTTTIYLLRVTAGDAYEQWIYVDGAWEQIGTLDIDLSGYTTDAELATALAAYVPASGGAFTGVVTGVSPQSSDDSTKLATTEWVRDLVSTGGVPYADFQNLIDSLDSVFSEFEPSSS